MHKKLLPSGIWTSGKVSSSLKSDTKHGNVFICNKQCLSDNNSVEMLRVSKIAVCSKALLIQQSPVNLNTVNSNPRYLK